MRIGETNIRNARARRLALISPGRIDLAKRLECGDLSPLLQGDLSPSDYPERPSFLSTSGAGRALAGRQVGQQPKRRQVAALQGSAASHAQSETRSEEPECARPRAQQRAMTGRLQESPARPGVRTLLRPGTGALRTKGFSLIEMMVAVTLLLIIIAALLAVFYQTQRAFRLSTTQVDVLESGRTAMELLTPELAEMAPSERDRQINLYAQTAFTLIQPRPAPGADRVNVIQDIFFLRQHNDEWIGTGYFVFSAPGDPIGTLYRFEKRVANVTDNSQIYWLFTNFLAATQQLAPAGDSHRVIDRVVNLRLSPYDSLGQFMTNQVDATYSFTNSFVNTLLPSYVDLELGIFEPRSFEHYRSLTNVSALRAFQYLSNHVEKVHLFRQRIPIRTAQ